MFAPRTEPAKSIYDAFQKEAEHRDGRHWSEWQDAERVAVWNAARTYAKANGLPVLTLEEIQRAETSACGHSDYGAKWALHISDMFNDAKRKQSSK